MYMESIPRAFAYTSATLLTGVIIYMFTQNIIQFINHPGLIGILFSLGFLLIYLNVNYLYGKRYIRKTIEMEYFIYVMAFLLILPALVLSFMTEPFFGVRHQITYLILIFMGSLLGASFGNKKGRKLRRKYFSEHLNQPDIPEDLRHISKHLSKN